ncbi:hypothetical protein [Enterococcus faecium]
MTQVKEIRITILFYLYFETCGEYKIFCVNEKIHTKKEVPSVE